MLGRNLGVRGAIYIRVYSSFRLSIMFSQMGDNFERSDVLITDYNLLLKPTAKKHMRDSKMREYH